MALDTAVLDGAFAALADPSRRTIVARLSGGPASVSELAQPLEMTLPSVMGHLDVLQRHGLVRSEKVGRTRTCTLQPAPLDAAQVWIAERRREAETQLDRLGDVLDATYGSET